MKKQEINGVTLTLKSEEGINPMMEYRGKAHLSKDMDKFTFTATPQKKRVYNTRVAKTSEGNLMMREVLTGKFKMQLYLEPSELTPKAVLKKAEPLLAEAKEGGWV